MSRIFPPTRRDLAYVPPGVAVSTAAVFFSVFFLLWGLWEVITAVVMHPSSWLEWLIVGFGSAKLVISMLGIIAVAICRSGMAQAMSLILRLSLSAFLAQFLVQWTFWVLYFIGIKVVSRIDRGAQFPGLLVTKMAVLTIAEICYLTMAWHMISTFRSLSAIIAAGGTGWEMLDYRDIKLESALAPAKDRSS